MMTCEFLENSLLFLFVSVLYSVLTDLRFENVIYIKSAVQFKLRRR